MLFQKEEEDLREGEEESRPGEGRQYFSYLFSIFFIIHYLCVENILKSRRKCEIREKCAINSLRNIAIGANKYQYFLHIYILHNGFLFAIFPFTPPFTGFTRFLVCRLIIMDAV